MDTHLTTKQELRRHYREKRIHLTPDELRRRNNALLEAVKQLDFEGFRTIHLFLSIAGNHEPDTIAIADWLWKTHPKIQLLTSKNDAHAMTPVTWEPGDCLKENSWKIPEPENGRPVQAGDIDALFVPLLAFDKQGHRVGYGKGFYDRFLSSCRPDAVKIGLSLFAPIDTIGDIHQYDIPLSMCITPNGKWVF